MLLLLSPSVSALSAISMRTVSSTSTQYGLDFKSPIHQCPHLDLCKREARRRSRRNLALNLILVPTMLPEISSEFKKSKLGRDLVFIPTGICCCERHNSFANCLGILRPTCIWTASKLPNMSNPNRRERCPQRHSSCS